MKGDLSRAMENFDRALQLAPASAGAHLGRGNVHDAEGDHRGAIAEYSEAISDAPNLAEAYDMRGLAYANSRDLPAALEDLNRAIALKPSLSIAYNNRCWARALAGQGLTLALADCDEALRLAPDNASFLNSRALVEFQQHDFRAAFGDYDASYRRDAHQVGSLYGRGVSQIRLGEVVAGQADISAATARDAGVRARYAAYGVSP
jgi:tetratricopeptide (TPR) repeat protein